MRSPSILPLLVASSLAGAVSGAPLLLQKPALNQTHIVFSYAGDLWSVPRQGGDAVRLTTGPGIESNPVFSPDGASIAFSGSYDGNVDVFTVAAGGGVPKRITWHPGPDLPAGFTPDGKRILFTSGRAAFHAPGRLFTISIDGGSTEEAPFPMAYFGAYSPDGTRIAYMPLSPATRAWKRYRGGRTTPIWVANLSTSKVEPLPRANSNDDAPMWAGDKIYFLSDRDGPVTLFSFDLKSKRVEQVVRNNGFDYKSASLGPGAIVLERMGAIELYDLKSGKVSAVPIRLSGDFTSVRPSIEKLARFIGYAGLSPSGARAVFEARGEILTVPAEKGDVRNLTNTSGVAERMPDWSPDGARIAYLSDESGEYQIHVRPQSGIGEVKKYDLGGRRFFYNPTWSPDGNKMLYRSSDLEVCVLDLASSRTTVIDRDTYDTPFRDEINPSWSPDSKWIVYTKILKNHLRAVFVYSLDSGKTTQLSDGLSDARHAAFDANGRHLYFTASTNQGLATGWLDMTSTDRNHNRSVYAVVLRAEDPSPLAPESDEEKAAPDKPEKKEEAGKEDAAGQTREVRIDFDGIDQRILALPIPARPYGAMLAGKTGLLFLLENPPAGGDGPQGPPSRTLHKFDLKTRKIDKFLDGVLAFELSRNGEKLLYVQGQGQSQRWVIGPTGAAPKPGEGTLKTDQMEARIDPVAEWRQIYDEVWRIQRDFFYDPGLHGLDLEATSRKYASFLPGVAHRQDLNYLMADMLGEMSVGHMNVGGGSLPESRNVPVGLLGADYAVDSGRYRFARVYNGENWNPQLRAPLTQPGVNVKAGEYLLAVNGRNVTSADNLYSFFEATAGKSVLLKVGPNPGGDAARDVTVVPVPNENNLRYIAWVEDNRRKVDRLSNGRLGYVHLPNTGVGGYTNFNRWFFAQVGKEGMVIDERFNGGGQIADYIVDHMRRPLLAFFATRAGYSFTVPANAVFGPKAMIINEYAGSGGDAMPWMFRKHGIGPLIGKRTWGGLVGIFGFPRLIDGGMVTAPNLAFYNTEKDWDVENRGVPPDIEVEYDPAAVRQGRDPQLEKAVEVLMESLRKNPLPKHEKPPYPNYHRRDTSGDAAQRP